MSAAQPGIAPTPQLPRPLAVRARTLPHRLGEPLPQRHALALTPGTAVCARLVGLQPRPVAGRRPDLRTVRLLLARVLAPSLAAPGVPLPRSGRRAGSSSRPPCASPCSPSATSMTHSLTLT